MPFGQPVIWHEPKDHISDCYFYFTNIKRFSKKSKRTIKYPEISSITKTIPHSRDLAVLKPPDHTEQISSNSENEKADKDFQAPETSKTPHLIS